jgi:hypothetical protein
MNFRAFIFILISAVTLTALFIALKPTSESMIVQNSTLENVTPITESAQLKLPMTIELHIENGALTSGPKRIQLTQGQELAITVVSDQRDELHLHGYDLILQLLPGEAAKLAFTASHSGRFGLELHHAHGELAVLEVSPKP